MREWYVLLGCFLERPGILLLHIMQPLCPPRTALHATARSDSFPYYPPRLPVSDDQVPWSTPWPEYSPTRFTAPHVIANDRHQNPGGWADPGDPAAISAAEWSSRISYEGTLCFDSTGLVSLNPHGRTGMAERGYLGKWGPNHAADPIVTRHHPESGQLQVVAIVRRDTGRVALPGGMVDAGELVTQTVKREFLEEAVNLPEEERAQVHALLTTLFTEGNGTLVFRGYVDDPRNTDNSWMETAAYHFHAAGAVANLQLAAGDDAAHAFWLDVNESDPAYAGMAGKRWVDAAAEALRQRDLMKNMRRR